MTNDVSNVYQFPRNSKVRMKEALDAKRHGKSETSLILACHSEAKPNDYSVIFPTQVKCPLCGVQAKSYEVDGKFMHFKCNVCKEFKVLNGAREVLNEKLYEDFLGHLSMKSQELSRSELLVISDQKTSSDLGEMLIIDNY